MLATLHANNCAESLDRITGQHVSTRAGCRKQVTLDMSQYLRALVAQRLVMGIDNKRVAAMEVMMNTPHIAELVKRGDVMSIKESIMQSADMDVCSFSKRQAGSLHKLFKQGTHLARGGRWTHADSRTNLEAKINFG